jgi:hypothetical protein
VDAATLATPICRATTLRALNITKEVSGCLGNVRFCDFSDRKNSLFLFFGFLSLNHFTEITTFGRLLRFTDFDESMVFCTFPVLTKSNIVFNHRSYQSQGDTACRNSAFLASMQM